MVKSMQNTSVTKRRQRAINAARRCQECSEEALGRCPDCRHNLCQDHFPKQQHSPCAEKQMKMAHTQVCYVCSAQVYPDQWSISRTSHYVDQCRCKGCGRFICDELHTQRKIDDVFIVREGLRGHRYQYVTRYCDICSPIYRIGGINGLARWIVVIGTAAVTIFFYLQH
jgi:hypothetical protein